MTSGRRRALVLLPSLRHPELRANSGEVSLSALPPRVSALGVLWLARGAIVLAALVGSPCQGAAGNQPVDWRGSWFGHRVLGLPDLDGDGAADVVVAAPGYILRKDGSVLALSSKSGKVLWMARGGIPGEWGLGWSMCLLGDLDGDFIPEVAASCPLRRRETGTECEVRILSGRSGITIRRFQAGDPDWSISLGDRIAAVGDLDGDGAEDLAVRDSFRREDGLPIAGIVVYSGKTAGILRRFDGKGRTGGVPAVALCSAGDWDGRGRPDMAITVPTEDHNSSRVLVVAGEDGAVVRVVEADGRHEGFGNSLLPGLVAPGARGPNLLSLTQAYDDRSGRDPAALFRLSPQSTEPVLLGKLPVSPSSMGAEPIWIRGPSGFAALVVAGTEFYLESGEPETRVYAVHPDDARPLWFANRPDEERLDFARSMAPIPDLDGDRVEDVVVGAVGPEPEGDADTPLPGRVYLLSGRTGALLRVLGPGGVETIARDDLTRLLPDIRGTDQTARDLAFRNAKALRLPDVAPFIPLMAAGKDEEALAAVELLGCVGSHAGPAVPAIRGWLSRLLADRGRVARVDRQDLLISACINVLVGEELRAWVSDDDLVEILASLPTIDAARSLAAALQARRVPAAKILPTYRWFLESPDGSTRLLALGDLARFPSPEGVSGDEVRRQVIAMCLSDPHLESRLAAGDLLRAWTLDAGLGLEPMLTLLRSRRPRDPEEPEYEEPWYSTDTQVAARLEAGLRGDLDPVYRALDAMSRQADPILRARAVVALGQVPFEEWKHAKMALGRIDEMRTDDPDPMVREAAELATGIVSARSEEK